MCHPHKGRACHAVRRATSKCVLQQRRRLPLQAPDGWLGYGDDAFVCDDARDREEPDGDAGFTID